jgi:hypothetical protein
LCIPWGPDSTRRTRRCRLPDCWVSDRVIGAEGGAGESSRTAAGTRRMAGSSGCDDRPASGGMPLAIIRRRVVLIHTEAHIASKGYPQHRQVLLVVRDGPCGTNPPSAYRGKHPFVLIRPTARASLARRRSLWQHEQLAERKRHGRKNSFRSGFKDLKGARTA